MTLCTRRNDGAALNNAPAGIKSDATELALFAAKERAEDPSDNLPSERAAHRACSAFRHGIGQVVSTAAVAAHAGNPFIPSRRCRRLARSSRCSGQRLTGPRAKHFEGRFPVHGVFIY